MKKVFFALLFLSVAGAGVLVWLIRSAPSSPKPSPGPQGLTIIDEKHEEAGKAAGHAEEEGDGAERDAAAGEHDGAGHDEPEHGEEHSTEKASAHEVHESAAHEESRPESKSTETKRETIPVLTVRTEPPGARVRVDGELRGRTPFELPLTEKEQKIEVEAEGFEPFTRTAPSLKEAGNGQLGWKVQLKSKPEPQADHQAAHHVTALAEKHVAKIERKAVALKDAVVPPPTSKELLHVGVLGPFVIPLKSIERTAGSEASVKESIEKLRTDLRNVSVGDVVVGCVVDLGAKGQWVRIVTGPFQSKKAALSRLSHYKNVVSDAYVAGAQKCLP